MQEISFYKKILSYFYPVRIRESSSSENPVLELFFYQGQYQLATADALYSDGKRYRPMVVAFGHLKKQLPVIKEVLVLGTGIGSAVHILASKGLYPACTLVDNDALILEWAKELLPQEMKEKTKTICMDAVSFMDGNDRQYDLVIVDIFRGRVVPGFVTQVSFLEKCHRSINPGGYLVLNYIENDNADWLAAQANIRSVFGKVKLLTDSVNRIVIAKV